LSRPVRQLFALLIAVILAAPAASRAGTIGDECRRGETSSCKTLCDRGYERACAKLQGQRRGGTLRRIVEFGEKSLAALRARGLVKTGLEPVFPQGAQCTPVASYFGDDTRHDGSQRNRGANFGYHGGMDLSLAEGTPIVAIAAGTVIHKREGGQLVGIELFLRHSPEDTGLQSWTFSKYKHLMEMPALEIGQTVRAGQAIGLSGRTGTVGGHYGSRGYPHLHLSVYASETGAYAIEGGRVSIKDGRHVDPLAVYFRRMLDSDAIRTLPAAVRKATVPYRTRDGVVIPQGSLVVWPVMCTAR
jgi:murein DD-endopeptidase MepM/ murein hydrolase activator NlpD